MEDNLDIRFINSIKQIEKSTWSQIINTDYPFIQYDFLKWLEQSGATNVDSGWTPNHLIILSQSKIIAVMPLYIKTHSYGEYIFDFQWANAYHQSGLEYYPKLVTAIPFTPCSGKRLYCKEPQSLVKLIPIVSEAIIEYATTHKIHSWHCLFVEKFESELLAEAKVIDRLSFQYHWFNQNYLNFDDFLYNCKTKQKKNIRQERKRVLAQGIKIKQLNGADITTDIWQHFFYFYQLTNAKKSGHAGYLNQAFFAGIANSLSDSMMMTVAYLDGQIIATSLFFKDSKTLYGRYWGCVKEYDFLHFELCYYQGIEYCIHHKLSKFDAGAQGEHKIPRGFKPVETYSNHWIANKKFSEAISDFVEREKELVRQSIDELKKRLPYKEELS